MRIEFKVLITGRKFQTWKRNWHTNAVLENICPVKIFFAAKSPPGLPLFSTNKKMPLEFCFPISCHHIPSKISLPIDERRRGARKKNICKVLEHIRVFFAWLGFFFFPKPYFSGGWANFSQEFFFFTRFFFPFFFLIFFLNILSHSKNYVLPFWGTQSNFSNKSRKKMRIIFLRLLGITKVTLSSSKW